MNVKKNAKKILSICVLSCLCLLCGCSEPDKYADYTKEEVYDEGYEEGYRSGYEEGIQYALDVLRENANDYEIFMDIEDIDESIHRYLGEDTEVDCCEVRDCIIYHPDFEHYTLRDLLERIIQSSIKE